MTYEEFEKCLVVEPTYGFMSDDMVAVELRFQAKIRAGFNEFEAMDDAMMERVIGYLKREFYKRLFGLSMLAEEFGMTEYEFSRWCKHKFYSDKSKGLV